MNKITKPSFIFGGALLFLGSAADITSKNESLIKKTLTFQESKKNLLEYTFKALEFKPQFNKPFCDAKIQTIAFLSADALLKHCLASVGKSLLQLDGDKPIDLQDKLKEFILKDNSLTSSNSTSRKLDEHKKVINEYKITEREFLQYLHILNQSSVSQDKLEALARWSSQVGDSSELIDLSLNTPQNLIMDEKSLEASYGKEFIEQTRTLNILSSLGVNLFYPEKVSKDLLFNGANLLNGCCFGMTHTFASLYKEKTTSGLDPLDAIKQITSQFSNGASLPAEKTQFLSDYFFSRFLKTPPNNIKGIIKKQQTENTEKPFSEKLSLIENLPPGEYEVKIGGKGFAHSTLLIKTMNKTHFIFDSNYGTLAIDEKDLSVRWGNLANLYNADALMILKI